MWLGADMAAVGELVLVLGLLVSAHCEVRGRDPEVEEEEEELGGRVAARGGGAEFFPQLEGLPPRATGTPPQGERGNYPARMGNWCAFVHQRMVTTAVKCGTTEQYTIKAQSPCPSGTPDCQLVMYKLATRPVYRQKKQFFTALLWRCCPGHGGPKCEDTEYDAQLDSGDLDPTEGYERAEDRTLEVRAMTQQQHVDPDREQNDHQAPGGSPYGTGYADDNQHNITHLGLDPRSANNPHQASNPTANSYDRPSHPDHPHKGRQQEHHLHATAKATAEATAKATAEATAKATAEATAALLVPHMMALVMSKLQPILEGFNHSLEHLSHQVGDLSRDVAQLKSSQLVPELQAEPPDVPELDEAAEERLNTRLDETLHQIREVRRQLESQQREMENRLHYQHVMLHYNLTSFKTDIDLKLKRQQKMLQVSLQAMNSTLTELKLDQDQLEDKLEDPLVDQLEDLLEDQLEDRLPPPTLPPPILLQPLDTSSLWEAIGRLDNMVVNNTVKVDGLLEDLEVTSGNVQLLRRDLTDLGKQINQTARSSQIQYMETGLEVDAAREVVLRRVGELAGNLSLQDVRLQEIDVDMDYLYTILYKHNSSTDCDCKGLKAAVAKLERGLANVTELANENRLALDEDNDGGAGQWGGASDWEPAVGTLQQGLQQVKETLTLEQSRTSTLEQSLNQLSSSVTVGLVEVSGLKATDRKLVEEMKHLSGSFNSLLKDAIRHSDVLELMLGEEVLEFLEWPVQDQEAHSIPVLKERLRLLDEQQRGLNLSITELLNRPGGREEVPSADQPLSSSQLLPDDWLHGSTRSSSGVPARERQLLLHPEGRRPQHGGDGSDLWNLEKTVEVLGQKVLLLEEKHHNTTTDRMAPPSGVEAKLQAEVMWLKRGLEDHLRVFKNVFSNADVLVGSDATLELDKLWQLMKNRDGKKEKKRGGGKEGLGRGGHHRSRRESSGVAPVLYTQSEDPLLLVAGSPRSVSNGVILLEASLNLGQIYSDTGTFTAPVNGIYLFVLTLDLRPGPAHVLLVRGSGAAPVFLHQQEVKEAGLVTSMSLLLLGEGEKLRLELKGGEWAESEDNVFTSLLLHRTT
ncbi:multimerin-2a isoform X2 [Labrus mixtus]|uniref:multimerin-2a isoform X2 n=1 Tax=Labrus mixtus TaxID=508554 RepID=UPI0029C0F3DB|nr:multimerin-2a isoform X2 [Labrus mixtus]